MVARLERRTNNNIKRVSGRWASTIALLLFTSLSATAQVRPDAGTILNQDRQPGQVVPQPPRQVLPPTAPPSGPLDGQAQIQVKQVVIEGATLFSETELQGLVADLVGKSVTLAQLRDAAERITLRYQAGGFFLSRAVIPQQDARDGVVRIRVVEAKYGKVEPTPNGPVRISNDRVMQILNAQGINSGSMVRREPLERGLMLLNDLPGVQANANMGAGGGVGQTDAGISLTEGPLLSGMLAADNLGNRYTGELRATAGLNINDPFGQGDLLNLRVNKSSGSGYIFGGYQIPVGGNGLKLNLNASALDYRLCCTFEALGARGHAVTYGGGLSYPLIMSQTQTLIASGNYERRHSIDDSSAGQVADRKVDAFSATLSWLVSDRFRGVNSVASTFVQGRLDLSANQGNATFDAATAGTQGDYSKFRASWVRLQTIDARQQLLTRFSGQWAGKNLDSSEKIFLGGYDGVRAYPQGEAGGDMGVLGTIEYSYALAVPLPGTLRASAFVDGGWVQLNKSAWPGFQGGRTNLSNSYGLSGIGVGLNWALPQNFILNLNVAGKIGNNPGASLTGQDADGRSSRVRGWLVLSKYL